MKKAFLCLVLNLVCLNNFGAALLNADQKELTELITEQMVFENNSDNVIKSLNWLKNRDLIKINTILDKTLSMAPKIPKEMTPEFAQSLADIGSFLVNIYEKKINDTLRPAANIVSDKLDQFYQYKIVEYINDNKPTISAKLTIDSSEKFKEINSRFSTILTTIKDKLQDDKNAQMILDQKKGTIKKQEALKMLKLLEDINPRNLDQEQLNTILTSANVDFFNADIITLPELSRKLAKALSIRFEPNLTDIQQYKLYNLLEEDLMPDTFIGNLKQIFTSLTYEQRIARRLQEFLLNLATGKNLEKYKTAGFTLDSKEIVSDATKVLKKLNEQNTSGLESLNPTLNTALRSKDNIQRRYEQANQDRINAELKKAAELKNAAEQKNAVEHNKAAEHIS
jgi:hypothetical protein